MYLSKVEIIGFKSFAQRVELKFDSGVTAIVGPNGCGKTNIVDAIRWALGEQRYSTLRSDKMEDVIFNGTKLRKPLGLSEVSLTIENTKNILPTEYSEVTVTRRVFRSGESEYLLNKVPCRLKDILDLFMDTGMGSDAYSVIELKMVETILSDKTDERRRLFEEAAGVTKYKFRRKAALRKLEDVQQDLARVNDIVKEVQKTVSSLERQARKAEQYNDVSSRLRAMEIDLLEREHAHLHAKLQPLTEKFEQAASSRSEIDGTLRAQEDRIEEMRASLGDTERQLAQAQESFSSHTDLIRGLEERILISTERRNALRGNIDRYEQEKSDLRAQQELLAAEQVRFRSRGESLREEVRAAEASYGAAQEELRALEERVEDKKAELESFRQESLRIAHEMVQGRGGLERLRAKADNLRGRIERSLEDNNLYQDDIKRDEEQIADLTAQDRDLRRRFVAAEMQLYEQEKIKKELRIALEGLAKKSLDLSNEIEKRKSKIEFLRRMIETNEGFPESTKYLLSRPSHGSMTTVADVLETREKYRAAVEAALGDAGNVLIVDRIEDGYAAIEELKRASKGSAMFLCLPWVPEVRRRGRRKLGLPFVWAVDVIQCADRYRPLANFLLDDVVIVDSVALAREVFATTAGIRCITLDGQVMTSSGFLRGGSTRLGEVGLLGKKAQIAELQNEIADIRGEIGRVEGQQAETTRSHDAINLKPCAETVKGIEKQMTSIEMRIAQLEFEKKRANDGIGRNRVEIEALEREIGEIQGQSETESRNLAALEARKAQEDASVGGATSELAALEAAHVEKARAVNELEIKVVTVQGDLRTLERDLERTEARLGDIALTLSRREEEIVRAREEHDRLTADTAERQGELETESATNATLEANKKEVERQFALRRNELHAIELRIKDERRLHDDAVTTTHDLEMKIAELKSGIEHLRLRAREEFDLDLELKSYPDDAWVDFAELREQVRMLKERIRILGAINFAAFDEFTTESNRLSFLSQQRDDLIEAEKTLLNTIEEINATAQRKFLETFQKIRENFIATFKELFLEGDECDLRLEENVDPLEAGIEIIAKPRGKRPTSIDLLSGGEKTLTAIALLFAIYLVKPSPFCILDEVDAPLDDSNIDRYTRILRKFSNNTQFIVVTHNKRTMEAASALYGVTMEEEGVSKIVTVRFNEEARVRSATVTN